MPWLLIVAVFLGHRKGLLKASGILGGGSVLLLSLIVALVGTIAIGQLVRFFGKHLDRLSAGLLYHPAFFAVAFSLTGLACAAALYIWAMKRLYVGALTMGASVVWLLVTLFLNVSFPGATFIFLWPLIFSLLGWITFFVSANDLYDYKNRLVILLSVVPGVLIIIPMIQKIFTALPYMAEVVLTFFLTMLMGIAIDQISQVNFFGWLSMPKLLTVTALALFLIALAISGYSNHSPRPNSVFYVADADAYSAIWASYDDVLDRWNSEFFKNARIDTILEYMPEVREKFLMASAPDLKLSGPSVSLLEERKEGDQRQLRLRLVSVRQAPVLSVFIRQDVQVLSATINGKELKVPRANQNGFSFHYYAVPEEGIELNLTIRRIASVQIQVRDASYGLPNLGDAMLKPRPADLAPRPTRFNDSTLVTRSFSF